VSDPSGPAGIYDRHDEQGTPPAVWLLAARLGALFGALFGIYAAIVKWIRTGDAGAAFFAWVRTALAGAIGFAVLYAVVLIVSLRRGRALASTEQRTVARVHASHERAFAMATRALAAIDDNLHELDLVAGTASVDREVREPLFGKLRVRVKVKVTRVDAEVSAFEVATEPVVGAIDFGATRALVDDVVKRIDEAARKGRVAVDAVGLDAVPAAARAMFQKNGYRVVGLRSLRRDAPAIAVQLLAAGDAPAQAIVLMLPRAVNEATFRAAAERARAMGAAQSRVGNGFAIVPLTGSEAPGRVAQRVHQALVASDPAYRDAAKQARRDEKDPASTSRMKWPR
jgi:hypothetical protein